MPGEALGPALSQGPAATTAFHLQRHNNSALGLPQPHSMWLHTALPKGPRQEHGLLPSVCHGPSRLTSLQALSQSSSEVEMGPLETWGLGQWDPGTGSPGTL